MLLRFFSVARKVSLQEIHVSISKVLICEKNEMCQGRLYYDLFFRLKDIFGYYETVLGLINVKGEMSAT